MPSLSAIPKYKTKIVKSVSIGHSIYNVYLHGSRIVKADVRTNMDGYPTGEARVLLNAHGWRTKTTKRRMNQVLAALNIPANVYQKDFTWYVSKDHDCDGEDRGIFYTNSVEPFYDNMEFDIQTTGGRAFEALGYGTSRSHSVRGSYFYNPKQAE